MRQVSRIAIIATATAAVFALGIQSASADDSATPNGVSDTDCVYPISEFEPNGDHVYTWRVTDESSIITRFPSSVLDPKVLSEGELSRYAVQPPPALDSAEYADWLTVATALLQPPAHNPGPMCASNVKAGAYSSLYSGFAARSTFADRIESVSTSYTAPTLDPMACTGSAIGQWVGVADVFTKDMSKLIQVGLGYVPSANFYGGFVEVVGGPWAGTTAQAIPVLYIPGHRYYMHMYYVSTTLWAFALVDLDNSSNHASGFIGNEPGGAQYIGTAGLFISERPIVGNGISAYMKHSDTRFRTATVKLESGTSLLLSDANPIDYTMTGGGGAYALGTADTLNQTTGSFTEHWLACS